MIKNIIKKILFVLLGVLLALLFLETAMRTTGFLISSYQKYHNNKVLKNKSQYTVVCIGESTTAGEYPVNLRQILDSTKFSVIDCGIEGADLQAIDKFVDDNLQKYNPAIAVCMMGGPDPVRFNANPQTIPRKTCFEDIKLYKLVRLTRQYFKSSKQFQQTYETALNDTNDKQQTEISGTNSQKDIFIEKQLQLGMNAYYKAEYQKAEKIYKNILQIDPKNETAYFQLFILYADNHLPLHEEQLYKMAVKALELEFRHEAATYYRTAIEYNSNKGNINKAKEYVNLLFKKNNVNLNLFLSVLYRSVKPLMTSEQKEILLKQIAEDKTDISYAAAALYYTEQKDYAKAAEFFQLAEDLRIKFPNEQTNNLYRTIIKKLIDKKIKVICMQYPTRSINPIKNIFKNEPYYDKITFLSNEAVFKKALKEKPYTEIFTDQFGGAFGHFADYGNTLIAENVAKTLMELTD